MKTKEFHPIADIFPMMAGKDFNELADDIRQNGLRCPIVLHPDGRILDGRNRYNACKESDVTPRYETWDGKREAVAYVVSLNMHRRQLTIGQKAMVAAKIANLRAGDNQHKQVPSRDGTSDPLPISTAQAASIMGVSTASVERARRVEKNAIPEIKKLVESGEVEVSVARRVADLPKPEQAALVTKGTDAVADAGKRVKTERIAPRYPDETTDETTATEKPKVRGKGLDHAYDAIACMQQITRADGLRGEAFDKVISWCKHNK